MTLIRPACFEDEPALLDLTARLALFEVPAWRTRAEIIAADHPILLEALRQPTLENSILVAEEPAGQVGGFVFTTTRRDYFTGFPHAHVEILAVAAKTEGRGLGQALLAAAEEWARGRGYRHVTLNVFASNARARAMYERVGYGPETVHYLKSL